MSSQPNPHAPSRRAFGPFVFDEKAGELRKHGIRVKLQGQPLQVLATLLEHPGDVVTREAIQQQLWKGNAFGDFEHGLNAAINRLRQALGDSADRPRYIETVPGKGYRFIAVIEEAVAKPVLVKTGTVVESGATATKPKSRVLWISACGLLVLGLLGLLLVRRSPVTAVGALVQFSILPPDNYAFEPGSSRQTFALSPDGRRMAFTAMNAAGVFETFVRDLNSLKVKTVAESWGSHNLFWAPDGESLFLTVGGALRRSPIEGESFQVICDAPEILLTGALFGSNILLAARKKNFVVPSSGGTPAAVNDLYPWPEPLPDGKHVLFVRLDRNSGHHRARVLEWGKPETERPLIETDSRVMYAPSAVDPGRGYLVYVRAGNILAHPFDPRSLEVYGQAAPIVARTYSFFPTGAADFSVSNNGMLAYRKYLARSQLAWVDRKGEVVKRVGPANVNVKHGHLSPDGKKIAAAIFDANRGRSDIWIIETESGASRRAISAAGLVDNPVWSADSRTLVYNGAYESTPTMFLRGIGESDREEALPADDFQLPGSWSRDGRFVAYTNTTSSPVPRERTGDISLIDLKGEQRIIQLIRTPFHEGNPAFSPDGKWLAFTSNESGKAEVYLQAFEGGDSPRMIGERYPVSRMGSISIRWSRDGKELFYLGYDGMVYAAALTFSPKPKIAVPIPLFRISTEARAAIHSLQDFDVSPDGKLFLVPIVTSAERSEIVVVQNWEAAVKRKPSN